MDPNCEVRCFRRSKWFPQGFFLNTISCLIQLETFFSFFCYFTVNVGKIKRASSSSGRILFFFSIQPKKVSFCFFPIFSGKIKCVPVLISSIFSRKNILPAMSHFIQERVTFTVRVLSFLIKSPFTLF